jgi:hypothetical protein
VLEPVAVNPPGLEVTVKEVAAPTVVAGSKDTMAAPLLNALPSPTSLATTFIGGFGATNIPLVEVLASTENCLDVAIKKSPHH